MIWIGTSGWIYPHWRGRFYPSDLPVREHLSYYADHFPTVEINRSFYRLPTYEQFRSWREQTRLHPDFCFAVKASRYITHLKKLQNVEEGLSRLYSAAAGLGEPPGPFLYQLPPHWHADVPRLEQFLSQLPGNQRAAFEFRDPTWFQSDTFHALRQLLDKVGCALVEAVGGSSPTPPDLPSIGPFGYIRFHSGAQGIGLSEAELAAWARRLVADDAAQREVFVYFNNDSEGYAIANAQRLQQLLKEAQAALKHE